MRVFVTGASGVFGRSIVSRLAREGVDVVAFARREVPTRGHVSFARGDIRDADAVTSAMAGCDRVVHLAWQLAPAKDPRLAETVNLDGTRNVLQAMATIGADHLVFASSVTVYGAWPDNPPIFVETDPLRPDYAVQYAHHKALAEQMIAEAGIPAVITRTVVAAGRSLDNYEFRFLASPLLPIPSDRETSNWQFMHSDDVGRFHVLATIGDRTGVVNLGPTDLGLSLAEVGEVLGKRSARVPFAVLDATVRAAWRTNVLDLDPAALRAALWMPVVDTSRMVDEWGYHPAFDSRSALADTRLALERVVYLGKAEIVPPWRMPAATTDLTRDVAVPGVVVDHANLEQRGEFDSLVDERYPEYSATNVGEAFPGPMTPLSLAISLDAMQAASAGMADFLGYDDESTRYAQRQYGIASFGHRLYGNFSVVRAMAEHMPGADVAGMEEQFLGVAQPAAKRRPVASRTRAAGRGLRVAAHVLPKVATIRGEVDALCERAREVPTTTAAAAMPDLVLLSAMESLRDQLLQTWWISSTTNVVAAALETLVARLAGSGVSTVLVGVDDLRSADLVTAVHDLGARAVASPAMAKLLRSTDADSAVERLDDIDPAFAAAFRAVLDRIGHRGPGELELANPTFAQRPGLLLKLVVNAMAGERRLPPSRRRVDVPRRVRSLAKSQIRWLQCREEARDAVARVTNGIRIAALEWGQRQVAAGVLERADDVFYLTYDEFFRPSGAAADIAVRRAERERLAALAMPNSFSGCWSPQDDKPSRLGSGESLTGIAASPGVARGPVRILDDPGGDVEPGDIVVVHVTDVGWTGLLAVAGAVIADVGGTMSHAAIVARECGIPAVVSVENATLRLRPGATVEVDGTAGTVVMVEDALADLADH